MRQFDSEPSLFRSLHQDVLLFTEFDNVVQYSYIMNEHEAQLSNNVMLLRMFPPWKRPSCPLD